MKRFLAIGVIAAVCVSVSAGANAALVKLGNLVLTADGGFTPRILPRNTFAPIDFQGYANLRSTDGSVPSPLLQAVVDFDRDGKLTTTGLAICDPARLNDATPAEARRRCAPAIVGTGSVTALIRQDSGGGLPATSPLTFFNGPRQNGSPTAIAHARTTWPAVQTFVITIPIERRPGAYRYRATIDVPPIAGGRGTLVNISAKIGKHWRFRGRELSYTAARCRTGVLRTHGRFTLLDGTIIDGAIEKGCTVLP